MNWQDLSRKRDQAECLVETADEHLDKIKSNVEAIFEKKIATRTIAQLTMEVTKVIDRLIQEVKAPEADPQEKLSKVVDVLNSLTSSLQTAVKLGNEEAIRLEATQEGMRRALEAIRETGKIRIKELERVERLSHEEEGAPTERAPGERPEKMSVKRNASSLRKSRESEDS